MAPLVLLTARYQQNNDAASARLAAQVRYVGRSGVVPLFDRLLTVRGRDEVRALLAAHGLAPAWTGRVAYHRLILSLRAAHGLDEVASVRILTAVALDDLGALLERRPVWVAGVHADTDHLHAHVLLAGGDAEGRPVLLRGRALAHVKRQIEARARMLAR